MLQNGAVWVGKKVNCSVTYLAANTASASANVFKTGIATFGIFIGVVILAIVGKLIFGLFQKN